MTRIYSPPMGSRLMDRYNLETADAVLRQPQKVRGLMEIDATQGRVTAHVIPALRALQRIVGGKRDQELLDRWNTQAARLAIDVNGSCKDVFGNTIALGDTNGGSEDQWLALGDTSAERQEEAVRRYFEQLKRQSAEGIHQLLAEACATVEDAEACVVAAQKAGMDLIIPSFQTNDGRIRSYEEKKLLSPADAYNRVSSHIRQGTTLIFGINCTGASGGIAAVQRYPEFKSFHPNFLDFPDTPEGTKMRLLVEKDPTTLSIEENQERERLIKQYGITPLQMREMAKLDLDFAGNCCGSTETESALLAQCFEETSL